MFQKAGNRRNERTNVMEGGGKKMRVGERVGEGGKREEKEARKTVRESEDI